MIETYFPLMPAEKHPTVSTKQRRAGRKRRSTWLQLL